jgi:hypothetical protein
VALPAATTLAIGTSDSRSLLPCERRYHTFVAAAGQAYTVRVTAGFAGSVRVRPVPFNGDLYTRTDPPFSDTNLGGTPLPLVSGVERVVPFTTSLNGGGTYVVEIDADGDETGAYTIGLSSP